MTDEQLHVLSDKIIVAVGHVLMLCGAFFLGGWPGWCLVFGWILVKPTVKIKAPSN